MSLVDLDEAKREVRVALAAQDGDELGEHIKDLAQMLADHLARREGRDPVAAGEVLLEAGGHLGGLAHELTALPNNHVAVLLNVLTIAGLRLTEVDQ